MTSLILLFFTFSVMGWLWEVAMHLVCDGMFVNRGVLFGPWLPIYGSGGILVLLLTKKIVRRPMLTFCMVVLVCAVVEYATSWVLETTQGVRWWDYSEFRFNLQGRICLEGLLLFGVGGCAFIYFLAPLMDRFLKKIPAMAKIAACVVLVAIFAFDALHAMNSPNKGVGITVERPAPPHAAQNVPNRNRGESDL